MKPDWQDELPTAEEMHARDEAVRQCRKEGQRVSIPTANGDSYAYPAPRGDIIWGINGGSRGFCICQGRTA